MAAELALVESFVARARSLPDDAKARSFQDAIRVVLELGREGRGSGKAVVFTESITTQEYLRTLLMRLGLADEEITLFRGTNDHARAKQAHERWVEEVGRHQPPGSRPTREVAVRLALVHEFRTRSKVLVCTEAGAKGLNLQFCETVINYDLPWNPQRIEQRIGRCHRYSQERDVTVVNFIGRDNEAQHLTFEILSQKLDLFGRVLDASDTVLHEPRTDSPELVASAVSLEFENDLRSIYSRARTAEEVSREIAALRDRIEARRDAYEREYRRTSQIIESRFDQDVRRVFRRLRDELPAGLVQLDRDLADLVEGYLASRPGTFTRSEKDGRFIFEVDNGFDLGVDVGDNRRFATGDLRGVEDAQPLNFAHPLVGAAIEHAKSWGGGALELSLAPDAESSLAALAGQSGVLTVARFDYGGFEPVQRLVAAGILNGSPARSGNRRTPVATAGEARSAGGDRAGSAAARRRDGRGRVRRSAGSREGGTAALRAGHRTARALRRGQGPRVPARSRLALPKSCRPPGSAATASSERPQGSASKPRSCGWPRRKRRWNGASRRWSPGKTRCTGNGEISTTRFGISRRPSRRCSR